VVCFDFLRQKTIEKQIVGSFLLTNADQLLTNAEQYLPFLEISASHANCIIDKLRSFASQTQE
jgi:hypothetical protein